MTNIRKHPEYFNPNFRFPQEQFKEIKNFEGRFMISTYGRLISINGRKKGIHILSPVIDSGGYYHTSLRKTPLYLSERIHVMVASAFINKPDIKNICVNHLDCDKLNNNVDNLEWTTLALNCNHAKENGLMPTGSDHHNALLNEYKVREIKNLLYKYTNTELGLIYRVHRRTINDIRLDRTWRRVL